MRTARCIGQELITWPGDIALLRTGYLLTALPPLDLVTSVRCIVRRADQVLVMAGGLAAAVSRTGGRLK